MFGCTTIFEGRCKDNNIIPDLQLYVSDFIPATPVKVVNYTLCMLKQMYRPMLWDVAATHNALKEKKIKKNKRPQRLYMAIASPKKQIGR